MPRTAHRTSRRTLVSALVAVGSVAAIAASGAASADSGGGRRDVHVQLLTFNDYHGYLEPPTGGDATLSAALDPTATLVGGGEYLATKLAMLRADHPYSVTATAGDLIGGSPFLSGLFHDEPSVESLNAMGLDVSGVGNHEFDEGLTELLRMQNGGCHPVDGCYFPDQPYEGADFQWLAANVVYTENTSDWRKHEPPRTVLPATWVRKMGGVKVGFIGMTLEGTPELVAQAGIQGLTFQDEVEAANRAAKQLHRQGVRTIVVLIHEGGLQAGTYRDCVGISDPIATIAANLSPKIDFIASGHTHQPYVCNIPDPNGNPRMVTSASSFGRVVTETWLTINPRSGDVRRRLVTSTNHLVTRDVPKDPAQTAIIDKWKTISAPIANRVVGSVTANITRSPNRDTESGLANLIADAQLDATSGTPANAQIALMNPGGVRADLTFSAISGGEQPGEITYGEAFAVQPFGNLLVTVTMTGAQVELALEQQYIPTRSRPVLILGVSRGLTFDYNGAGAAGDRISNINLNGVPLDAGASYQVTVNNFLADGGDGFTAFTQGTNRIGGGDDLAAFATYLGVNAPVAPPTDDRINGI
jgi:2',3'-cyclic-nucleotide 2'-phosphodiesterase (5'-nucleotidase family)